MERGTLASTIASKANLDELRPNAGTARMQRCGSRQLNQMNFHVLEEREERLKIPQYGRLTAQRARNVAAVSSET